MMVSVNTAASVTSYEIKNISYYQIQSIVGKAASAAAVIGAVLYFVPGAQSIGGAIGSIGTIVSVLNSSGTASKNHGIKVKVKVVKYYRTRLGSRHVYKTVRTITSGSIY